MGVLGLREAQVIIEQRRKHFNTKRPLSALSYRPIGPASIMSVDKRPILHYQTTGISWTRLGIAPEFQRKIED